MRRLVALLALTAAAAAAPPAGAVAPAERAALREALTAGPAAAGRAVIPLPLPAPPRAGAAFARAELARLARDDGPGHVLVGLRAHADAASVTGTATRLGAGVRPIGTIGVLAVSAPSVAALTARLRRHPGVAYVERDSTLRTAGAFDGVDPATGVAFNWAFDAVRAGDALAAAGGGSRRQVAVIDTGVDAGHPDLAGRIGKRRDTATGLAEVRDLVGHGTFVAGLIAANGAGGRGVAGATTVYPVRASLDGSFTEGDLLRGVEFAISSGADVVNLSLAGDGFGESQARALDSLYLNNVLPVAAAGNRALAGNPLEYPAAAVGGYRGGAGIGLSVAATRPDGRHAPFSAHNEFVSLAAPGAAASGCAEGVFSTLPSDGFDTMWDEPGSCSRTFREAGGRYGYAEGTSFAAPIASGIAALTWQVEPRLDSEQVADVLVRSARRPASGRGGWNRFTGRGLVDGGAAAALARLYDTSAPAARATASRRANRVTVSIRRSRDRTRPGRRLAGRVTYALLDSSTNGAGFRFAVRPRSRPFRHDVRLADARRHLLVASVCDGNGNCASKRLGSFRRR